MYMLVRKDMDVNDWCFMPTLAIVQLYRGVGCKWTWETIQN